MLNESRKLAKFEMCFTSWVSHISSEVQHPLNPRRTKKNRNKRQMKQCRRTLSCQSRLWVLAALGNLLEKALKKFPQEKMFGKTWGRKLKECKSFEFLGINPQGRMPLVVEGSAKKEDKMSATMPSAKDINLEMWLCDKRHNSPSWIITHHTYPFMKLGNSSKLSLALGHKTFSTCVNARSCVVWWKIEVKESLALHPFLILWRRITIRVFDV